MVGKSVPLPEEVSRTLLQLERRSKACREKSDEVIVPRLIALERIEGELTRYHLKDSNRAKA